MRMAVIGAGVSGLGAAWLARHDHHVKLYEKASRIGVHAHTVVAHFGSNSVAVDTGFIVYNEANYPNLIGLFDALGVETLPTAIFGAVKQGIKPNIMAISTMLLGVSVVMVTLSWLISQRDTNK